MFEPPRNTPSAARTAAADADRAKMVPANNKYH